MTDPKVKEVADKIDAALDKAAEPVGGFIRSARKPIIYGAIAILVLGILVVLFGS